MSLKKLCLVLLFLSSVTSLVIQEECHAKKKWVVDWKGSHIDIIAWLPDNISHTPSLPTDEVLSLNLQFRGSSSPYEYDHIEINRTGAKILRVRGSVEEDESITFPEALLGHGWTEFNFTAQSSFDLWYKSKKLVSLEPDRVVRKIIISSSNCTVNCYRPEFVWNVTASESAVLPLAMEEQEHHLSFFSNSKTKPIIALGNTDEVIQLGWDKSTMIDITKVKVEYHDPLPASVQYWITVSCLHSHTRAITCSILVGKEKERIKAFHLKAMPETLSVSSGKSGDFYVFLQRPQPPLPTLPSTLPQDEKNPESALTGMLIASVVLALAFLGALIGLYLDKKKRKAIAVEREAKLEGEREKLLEREREKHLEVVREMMENRPLINKISDSNVSSLTNISHEIYQEEPRMWEAVRANDFRLVEFLLRKGVNPMNPEKRKLTAFLEAHILCHKEILHLMSWHNEKCATTLINELVNPLLNDLELRMKKVFDAAELGMYEGRSGVKLLLEAHSLPPTIRNHDGWSLVHYMVYGSFIDGRPAWDVKDIEEFLKNQEYYINAIDHWGHTPLHKLSQRNKKKPGSTVFWNNKEQTLDEAWLEMAHIFLNHGCDPRIPNHEGVYPQELARENGHHELAKLLEEKFNEKGKIDHEVATKKFKNYVLAAKEGNTAKMITLLKDNVPLLPVSAHADPLVEAIRNNRRDAVFLLLSAGTPLTNRYIEGITPLEAAHNTVDLPAFFPALIRKVYTDRLEAEQEKIPCDNLSFGTLLKGIKEFKKQITESGSDVKWKFTKETVIEKNKEARELLVQAAELGLFLVCQCLSQEDVNLYPLKNEEKPFHKAIQHKKVDTQFALYRDLMMSPFTFSSSTLENLNKKLLEDIWVSQIRTLEEILAKQHNDILLLGNEKIVKQYVEDLKKLSHTFGKPNNGRPLKEPPDVLLYIVAEQGLDLIYYTLSNSISFDIDTIVDQESKCTALHIASMHGRLKLVELLVYKGADLNLKTIGGFEAIHLAAVRGHKGTTTYISEYMKSNGLDVNTKCSLGLTAFELLNKYEEAWKNSEFLLMTHKDALFVKNEKGDADKAYEILKRKGNTLPIKSPNDLLNCIDRSNYQESVSQSILEIARKETEQICKPLENSPFEGKLISFEKPKLKNKLLWANDVYLFVELSKFQCLDSNQTIECENIPEEETCSIKTKAKSDDNLFIKTNFIERFSKIMKTSIANYVPSSPDISIAPPFFKTNYKGVCIYLTVCREEVFSQLTVHLVPLIPAKYPEGSAKDILPHKHTNILQDHIHLHPANLNGEWVYRPYYAGNQVLKTLNENHRKVWISCCLIMQLLDNCAWAPRFEHKHYDKPLRNVSVGVSCFPLRVLMTLFLMELRDQHATWGENDLFDRILSIFQRTVTKDANGNSFPKQNIPCLIMPQYHYALEKESVCGILKYLEELQSEDIAKDQHDKLQANTIK